VNRNVTVNGGVMATGGHLVFDVDTQKSWPVFLQGAWACYPEC